MDIEPEICMYACIRECSAQETSCSCLLHCSQTHPRIYARVSKVDRMQTLGHWLGNSSVEANLFI